MEVKVELTMIMFVPNDMMASSLMFVNVLFFTTLVPALQVSVSGSLSSSGGYSIHPVKEKVHSSLAASVLALE